MRISMVALATGGTQLAAICPPTRTPASKAVMLRDVTSPNVLRATAWAQFS